MLPYFLGGGGGGGGGGVVDIGDNIAYSLMLDSASSQYLSRTFGTPTNNRVWTFSAWVKRGLLTSANDFHLFMGASTSVASNPTTYSRLSLNATTGAYAGSSASSAGEAFVSNQYKRDPAGWEHIVWVMNATGTVTTFYLGGTETGYTSRTNPSASDPAINKNGYYHRIGLFYTAEPRAFDGYLANVCFVDGQALTPAAFGRVSADTGQWVAKSLAATNTAVAAGGTWGANGFFLDFSVSSDLGNDVAAIDATHTVANDWLPVNTSTANQYTDTPTNSYCVLNPLYPSTSPTYSLGNTRVTTSSTRQHYKGSMPLPSTGQWYWECRRGNASASNYQLAGIALASATIGSSPNVSYPSNVWGYGNAGWKADNGSQTTGLTASSSTADVWGFKYDADADTFDCLLNNSVICSFTGMTGEYVPYLGTETGSTVEMLFGQAVNSTGVSYQSAAGGYFKYDPTSTYKALCTANLPTPAIIKPALHMNAKTRTGTGATYSVTGELFQPDLVWTKGRSGATDNQLFDSVRGTTKLLVSNSSAAESTAATGLTAFNSDGYTAGALAAMNTNAATYIDWMFKGGGAAVSNTSGSITSSVSANTTAGISIVTYTGTGANATVGHGLGVAPKLIIVKNRTTVRHWPVYHANLTSAAYFLYLSLTNAQASDATQFQGVAPTSTVFSLGTAVESNQNTNSMLALCFAEVEGFSKIGSYTGNADANGTFVYCGFEPRWVLVKGSSGTGDWRLYDTARDTYNASGLTIYPNLSNGEGDGRPSLDILSNGFKLRLSAYPNNAIDFVFIAIAEAPMKFSTAR